MIIVEGPDGGGKTTLIERLLEVFPDHLLQGQRACTSENGPVDQLREWVNLNLAQENHSGYLYDRHPLISEPIYGPIIRGYMEEGFNDFGWLHGQLNRLKNHRPLIIFCLPPWLDVEENVRVGHKPDTPHLRGVLRTSRALYDAYSYRAAMNPFHTATWVWDYKSGDFSSLSQTVRSHIGH